MARAIADGLSRNYPEHAATFKKNLDAYLAKLDAAIARWEKEAAPLKGKKLVSYHPDMIYFAERFGMEAVGTIEIRAGVDPTPAHIAELEEHDAATRRSTSSSASCTTRPGWPRPSRRRPAPSWSSCRRWSGGVPQAKDYISFIDYNVQHDAQGRAGRRMSERARRRCAT